jgi:hypothetical protein
MVPHTWELQLAERLAALFHPRSRLFHHIN